LGGPRCFSHCPVFGPQAGPWQLGGSEFPLREELLAEFVQQDPGPALLQELGVSAEEWRSTVFLRPQGEPMGRPAKLRRALYESWTREVSKSDGEAAWAEAAALVPELMEGSCGEQHFGFCVTAHAAYAETVYATCLKLNEVAGAAHDGMPHIEIWDTRADKHLFFAMVDISKSPQKQILLQLEVLQQQQQEQQQQQQQQPAGGEPAPTCGLGAEVGESCVGGSRPLPYDTACCRWPLALRDAVRLGIRPPILRRLPASYS
jgi:hypothetical protein